MSTKQTPFRHRITAGFNDSFSGRRVRPVAVMRFLEETAAQHCRAVGRDVFNLLERREGWVLVDGGLRMDRYPSYGEEIIIETWISRWRTLAGTREYRIYNSDGDVLGEAGSRWTYWNLDTRKPVPVPEFFRKNWPVLNDSPYRGLRISSMPSLLGKTPDDSSGTRIFEQSDDCSIELDVRRNEVDMYGHLHNTVYLDWLMESMPDHLYSGAVPTHMGLKFHGEARLGDRIKFTSRRVGEGWLHEVVRLSDGALLARGRSLWAEIGSRISA